jgi:hypothetical protein
MEHLPMFSKKENVMNEKAQENVRLFNELREFSKRDIPKEVSAAAARHRERIVPECLKPYDLLRYSTFADLPQPVQSHIESCSSCRTLLLPRIDPHLVDDTIAAAAAAASIASERVHQATPWYSYPMQWAAAALGVAAKVGSRIWEVVRMHPAKPKPKGVPAVE